MDLLGDDGLLDLKKRGKRTDPEAFVRESRDRAEAPAANAALQDWSGPTKVTQDGCHVCGRRPRLTCQSCDRPVCASDSWVMLGVCRSCATEERMQAWNKERRLGDNWLG